MDVWFIKICRLFENCKDLISFATNLLYSRGLTAAWSSAAMLFHSEADRRIFNVENLTMAEGGTAISLE